MPLIDSYFQRAVAENASDIHIGAGAPVYLRVLGILKQLAPAVLDAAEAERLVMDLIGAEAAAKLQSTLEIDTSYTLASGERFRVNAFKERQGWSLVARLFSKSIRGVEELGLPAILNRFADSNQGLILITGPGRSGKSTTAAALVDHINSRRDDHVITIEDPIEYLHPRKKCLVNQRSVGPHTDSFAAALRGALREDPDIILVGELRDTETMSLALTAAETGHLVIGTLHTNSAAATVSRVINMFPSAERAQATTSLSEALVGIISQRLIPSLGGRELVPAFEVLVNSLAVANVIISGEHHKLPQLIATGQKSGMMTLEASLHDLVMRQVISKKQADDIMGEEL
jgi:twitching motility protein PilT